MPKIKTRKSASKRLKLTGTGKVKYTKMGMRKKLSKKSSTRKRRLKKAGILSPAEQQRVRRLLPNS